MKIRKKSKPPIRLKIKIKSKSSKSKTNPSKKSIVKNKNIKIFNIKDSPITVPVTVVSPKKEKKSSTPTMYFTKDTEDAIVLYNTEPDNDIRNEIYNTRIKYAFEKLVENVFNTFKFTYFDVGPLDVQKETLSHLIANIHRYEAGKGKAYSYFSIVAKHYLIFNNNTNYKMFNRQVDISEENEEHTVRLQSEDAYYKNVDTTEFMQMMLKYWDTNIKSIFPKQKDLKIAEAIIELFRNSDRLDFFNKKALYLYIREISACRTQNITKIINRMKEYQRKITKSYMETGAIS